MLEKKQQTFCLHLDGMGLRFLTPSFLKTGPFDKNIDFGLKSNGFQLCIFAEIRVPLRPDSVAEQF